MSLPYLIAPSVNRNKVYSSYINSNGIAPSSCVSIEAETDLAEYGGYCASAYVDTNGKVCAQLPVVGKKCLSTGIHLPVGARVDACVDVCKKFGVPTGACLTLKFNGHKIARQCYGIC
ncbi:hypothetical protein [Bacillus cereus]|uniref:hypothetical protein n=1 Tax=Bacillus cereus TaxID=1396 RepID=UPI00217DED01|nr:hypothetical protein [Bacillus cereus]MCS6595212.1 hypothetical protein [Bacillus cereus]